MEISDHDIACSSPGGLAHIHSKRTWTCPDHLGVINNKLMDVAAGRSKRVAISLPPRHGKSELICRYFPPWLLGSFLFSKVILASYEANFAASWGAKARDVLTDTQNIFKIAPAGGYNASAQSWKTPSGEMMTSGVGGPLTGKGYTVGIIDDPVKNNEEAMSATIRNKVWDWYLSTFLTRAEPDAAIIVIMTRWHGDDLIGRLMKEQAGEWEHIIFPAIAGPGDPLGRAEGAALWPDRYPIAQLESIKKNLGGYWFSAMYQQDPIPEGGGIFKRDWFRYYKLPPLKIIRTFWSWDTAHKTGEANDYSVGTYWAETPEGYYLLKLVRARLEYPDLKRTIIQQFAAHPATGVLIEDKSSGQSVIQDLRRDTTLPIILVEVVKDKITRAHLSSPLVESGRVFIPEEAPWVADFIDEMAHFPKSAHDDQVDSTTQFLNYMASRPIIKGSSLRAGGKMATDGI